MRTLRRSVPARSPGNFNQSGTADPIAVTAWRRIGASGLATAFLHVCFVALLSFVAAGEAAAANPVLSVASGNPASGVTVLVYPTDVSGLDDGTAPVARTYTVNTRVWLSAALRAGNNYFVKWQKDGVDYDTASTTSVVMDANHTLTAVYQTPSCTGVAVYPGTDSIKAAAAAYPAGTTFCIKAGIHRMTSSITARTGDKYIGEPGAILNGSKIVASFQRSGSYWVATGQSQQETAFQSTNGPWPVCESTAPACIYPEKVFLNGQDLWQVTSLAALQPGTFFFDYGGNAIYLFDDPTGKTVEATTGSGGLIGYSGGTSDSVTVKNLVFEKFGGGLATAFAHNSLKAVNGWRVENNEFRLISNVAVYNGGNGVVRNNFIHHNGRYAIVGGGTFEGNVIVYNNTDGWNTGNDAGASKFHGTIGVVARGNIVSNNQSRGLWADTDNINALYENNIIENNVEMGILHEKSCALTIKNNVLRGNNSVYAGKAIWYGGQISARQSKDIQIFGNDVTAAPPAANGISLYTEVVNGANVTTTGTNCGVIELRNIAVHDNVVRLSTGQQHGIAGGGTGYAAAHNLLFYNNTNYLQSLTGAYFQVDGGTIKTKDQWQAAGQETGGRFYSMVSGPTPSSTQIASTANPSLVGNSVTFTATVTGSAPSGSVAFVADGTTMSGCGAVALPTSTANSKTASCSIATLTAGVHSIVANYSGNSANTSSTSGALSEVVNSTTTSTTTVVWIDDAVPTGARLGTGGADVWNWSATSPAPYSGSRTHQSTVASGLHQHYFFGATTTLPVVTGDTLYAYVYLDPAAPPREVMLQWNDGTWEHRAYWGADLIKWGTNGTASRRYMGALPPTGQWAKLAVSASQVGLAGRTVNGMAFTLYDGRATWDRGGKN